MKKNPFNKDYSRKPPDKHKKMMKKLRRFLRKTPKSKLRRQLHMRERDKEYQIGPTVEEFLENQKSYHGE